MRDSNSRPLGPKPSALAIWANSRKFTFLEWWAWVDSNHRPHPYQRCALTAWATRPFFSHTYHFSGAKRQNRTADTRLFRPLLYHWATLAHKRAENFIFIFLVIARDFCFFLIKTEKDRPKDRISLLFSSTYFVTLIYIKKK